MIGVKFDIGKNRLDLLIEGFLWEVGETLTHGALVYGDTNFKEVPDSANRYRAAIRRHELKSRSEPFDSETKHSHWAHVASNAMFLWNLETPREIKNILPCLCVRCCDIRSQTNRATSVRS